MTITDGYHELSPGKIAAVVTYVQMTARPTWIDASFPGALSSIPLEDLAAYRAMFRRVGENWLWFSRLSLSDEKLRERLTAPGYRVLVFDGGRGFVELDRKEEEEVEISLFGLAPEEIGSGLGRSMMAHALREAWSGGTKRVWLHTCTLDDPRALGFYRRMGFSPMPAVLQYPVIPACKDCCRRRPRLTFRCFVSHARRRCWNSCINLKSVRKAAGFSARWSI